MFNGLYSYEAVMLVMGGAYFVVLATLLVFQIVRGRAYRGLLVFFLIPIAMMGYPGVKSIHLLGLTLDVENTTQQLQANPTNAALRSNLHQQVAPLADRPMSDPEALATIAAAQFALGQHAEAEATLRRARAASPALPSARRLDERLQLDRDLRTLTAELIKDPGNSGTKLKLQQTVAQAGALRIASPVLLTNLASADAALGDRTKALELVHTALKIKPDLPDAQRLSKQLER